MKRFGVCYCVGFEFEMCGYGCEDYFYECDMEMYVWEVIVKLCEEKELMRGAVVDVGASATTRGARYNC